MLFTLAILCGFGMLVYRLWYLQHTRHAEYVGKVPGQKELRVRVPGVRGEIKDRNGVTLVSNKPSFEVRVVMKEVIDEYRRQLKEKKDRGEKVEMPAFNYELVIQGIKRSKSEPDYVEIFNQLVASKLNEMGLAKPFSSEELRVHTRAFRGLVPWVYRDDLSFEEFSRFAEHNLGLPGLSVAVRPVRQYLYGSFACHLLGYVGQPDIDKVPEEERRPWGNYYVPDDYGAAGIEKTMNKYLVGKPGVRTVRVDQKGAIVGEVGYEEPRKGNDVLLTIDARIQMIAERALRDGGIGRGAVVVIEPNSGEVLAMASTPSYDPNKFIPSISQDDWDAYLKNPVKPLSCRALGGYAPGSTYKIVTALAGCLAGITNSHFSCGGSVTYGTKAMKCWIADKGGSHGSLDLSDAIKQSCNCFFYQYGNRAGLKNIDIIGRLMGLGQRSGVELDEEDERSLILPGEKWVRQNKPSENWRSPGFVANVSIGQGLVQASPLQMCNVAATVANGGRAYPVHLLKRVVDGTKVVFDNQPEPRGDLIKQAVTPQQFELVRRGMWKVVNADGGTGKAGRLPGVEVAGKTGTAQFLRSGQKDNHTWFISFAPYKDPKFAVCALTQGGKSGGLCAAPVVKRVLEQALALDQGYKVAIEQVREIAGDFKQHEAITFSKELNINLASSDDDVDAGAEARHESVEGTRKVAPPKVRRKEDAAGSRAVDPSREVPKAVPVKKAGFFQRIFGR
ncbi:MAG: penicillin-binding protein 2 [Verrucomicrobiaceae bacterium]|nr:penicillin-binding protein 2 [Verrucomicrobiaceae bacterium]